MTEMSNQSHFPGFFSPRKVNLKFPINSGLGQAGAACSRKMTLGSCDQNLFSLFRFSKFTKKLAGPPVYYSGSNESSLACSDLQ
jgi:hypothetical protein